MADEPMNLEGELPVEAVAPVVEPAAPVVEAVADPDEANAVELPAGKHVPLTALKAVREENKALKDKAAQADRLAQENAQLRPYAELVQNNQQLFRPQAPQAVAQPDADPDLVDLAKSLDFYQPDGKPDLARAQTHQKLVEKAATKIAQQTVAPFAMNTYRGAVTQNWQRIATSKLPNGQPIDQQLLTAAWQSMQQSNPAALADPNMMRILENNVMMEQLRANPAGFQQPAPPGRAPVQTSDVGSRPATKSRMTDSERALLTPRGITDEKFADMTKDFQAGRMNALED